MRRQRIDFSRLNLNEARFVVAIKLAQSRRGAVSLLFSPCLSASVRARLLDQSTVRVGGQDSVGLDGLH